MARIAECIVRRWIFCLLFAIILPANAFYYGEPERFVESSYDGSDQFNQDMAFDDFGNIHVVWLDEEGTSTYQIFHRMKVHQGGNLPTGKIAFDPPCELVDCFLNRPMLTFGYEDLDRGFCVFSRGVSPYGIEFSWIDFDESSFAWTYAGSLVPSTTTVDYAVASYNNHVFFIYGRMGGFRVLRMTDGVLDGTMRDFIPNPDFTLYHPDICTDDEGYVYVVYETYNSSTLAYDRKVTRSELPEQIEMFWAGRTVAGSSNFEYPSIAATGTSTVGDLRVGIGRVEHTGSEYRVEGKVEVDGDWISGPVFLGHEALVQLADGGQSASNADVAFGRDHAFHIVWRDNTVVTYEAYASVSYDDAVSFTSPQCLNCDTTGHSTTLFPKIASSREGSHALAIALVQKDLSGSHHPWLIQLPTHYYDRCDTDFSNWDSVSGVMIDATVSHDVSGHSFRFETNTQRGLLYNDYQSAPITGNLDFWFYDTLSQTADFHARIEGDDGSKAGVYRMIGINNASSHTAYSVHGGTSWQVLSNQRTTGWHHVIIQVSGSGLEMLLDPETNAIPVLASNQFVNISRIEFEGGSSGDPYYLDDVTITAEVSPPVPANSIVGILLAIIGFTAIFRMRRIQVF